MATVQEPTDSREPASELKRSLASARRALNKALKAITTETDVDAVRAWPDMHDSLVRQVGRVISDAETIRRTLSRLSPDGA